MKKCNRIKGPFVWLYILLPMAVAVSGRVIRAGGVLASFLE